MSIRRYALPAFFAAIALLAGSVACTDDELALSPPASDGSDSTAGISLDVSATPQPTGVGVGGGEPDYGGAGFPPPQDLPGAVPGSAGPDTVASPPLPKLEPAPGVIMPMPPDRAPDYPANPKPLPSEPRPLATGTVGPVPMPIDPSVKRVLAPIEAVDMRVAESSPPQYFLGVTSGLPNGCAKFDFYTVERDGDTIEITVWNTMPADPRVVLCTMIYGTVQHNVPLGSDFQSGRTYHLKVNDVTTRFVAQ